MSILWISVIYYDQTKKVLLVKALKRKFGVGETRWDLENTTRESYPILLSGKIFGDENP